MDSQDHEDQIQMGMRIIQAAFQDKVHTMEQQIRTLSITCEEQKNTTTTLQKKNTSLEAELMEHHQRAQHLAEENKELFKTVGSLRKQIARLEGLRAAVLSSIQDDQAQEAELGDTRALLSDDYLKGATPLTASEMGYAPPQRSLPFSRGSISYASRESLHSALGTLHPGSMTLGADPVSYTGSSIGSTEPAVGRGTAQDPDTSSQNDIGVTDGRQFFRLAKSKLTFEGFNSFLASIKKLNSGGQTREDTIDEVRALFGPEHKELFQGFERLLNSHGM